MYFDVNFSNQTFTLFDRTADNNTTKNPIFKYHPNTWPLIASLLVYDCIDRSRNAGYATIFSKIVLKLVTHLECARSDRCHK